MTLDQNELPLKAAPEPALPWSVGDSWIGLALIVIIQIAVVLAVVLFRPSRVYGTVMVIGLELIYLIPAVIILAWRRADWRLLGYRRFGGSFITIGCGFLVGVYVISFINNTIFQMFGQALQSEELIQLLSKLPSPDSFIFTGVILAPIVEETFFRGFLFAGFRQGYGWKKAALLSSAFFAACHLQPAALIPTFLIGYIFSYLYHKSNSIFPGMILHFLVNAFGFFTILLLTRSGIPIPR